jgi:hypothetical protein
MAGAMRVSQIDTTEYASSTRSRGTASWRYPSPPGWVRANLRLASL